MAPAQALDATQQKVFCIEQLIDDYNLSEATQSALLQRLAQNNALVIMLDNKHFASGWQILNAMYGIAQ